MDIEAIVEQPYLYFCGYFSNVGKYMAWTGEYGEDVSGIGDTNMEALENLRDVVLPSIVTGLLAAGKATPEPFAEMTIH